MKFAAALLAGLLAAAPARADLAAVKAEPNLEKRSDLALAHAHRTLEAARRAYHSGPMQEVESSLAQVLESINLSLQSLRDTGKNPRRSPKYFKRGEIEIRKLMRRLDGFRDAMSVDDRPMLDALTKRAHQIHEELLAGIMSKSK